VVRSFPNASIVPGVWGLVAAAPSAPGPPWISYRQRPWEADHTLPVLFDHAVKADGSEVLKALFPGYDTPLDDLADNIGMARLWAGIHWRSDHTFGRLVGKAVGHLVIAQLNGDGAGSPSAPPPLPALPPPLPAPGTVY